MSFSRLLQNAPYYFPAAFSPSRKRQLQDDVGPSSSTASALAKARRTRAARPLVDPYTALPAPEFDSFVDDVSSRIVNALTYEPNKDRRIRRGYADDEEYWLEMGGKPGEFVGNQTQEAVEGEDSAVVEDELDPEAVEPEQVEAEDAMSEDVLDDIEAGETLPVQEDTFEEGEAANQEDTDDLLQSLADHALPPAPDSTAPSLFSEAAPNSQHITFNDLYPDLTSLDDIGSLQAAQAGPSRQDVQIQPGNMYPSLDQLQGETAPPLTVNEDYQLDLLRQFNHDGFSGYAESTPQFLSTQTHDIEDLLDMAERDAQEVNEAIQHIREEEEKEEQLDNELLEVLEHDMPHEEMQVDSSEDDILVPLDEEDDDDEVDAEELTDDETILELPPSKQKSTSREASDVISIGSTSDEEEDEEEDAETEEEADEAENAAIVLEEEEEQEEEDSGEENDSLEVTPPPPIQASVSSQAGPSRQLFGQLDAPVASQSRFMSQKIRRRMDEDDLQASGFDEEDAALGSGSSEASDEQTREWQQFRRKAGKGQRAQDDQDAADRYFDDETDGQENDEDEDEEESDEGESEEDYAARSYRKMQKRAAAGEFEDELDDDAIAHEERQASRAEADLDERVPIPAFMKRDKETGEYDLRVGSSSEGEEDEEDSEEEEEDDNMEEHPEGAEEESEGELKIEVLEDDELEVEVDEEEAQSLLPEDAVSSLEAAATRILSEEVDEVIDLAQSPAMQLNTEDTITYTSTTMSVEEIIETSMATEQASTFAFAGLPPLPQSLVDVAENLVNEAIEVVGEELVVPVQETVQAAPAETTVPIGEAQQTEKDVERESRRKSREPSFPAFTRTPRKSVEPSLVASMGVSPEQFSLSPKVSRPSKEQDVTANPDSTASIASLRTEEDANYTELDKVSHLPHPSHFTEDHHHEPPPPELTEEEHFEHPHALQQGDELMAGVDLTTDEMENHSAGEEEEKEEIGATSHFTEDHHQEPPPPELTEEVHFAHDHPASPSKGTIESVDLTTDEMENHSGGENEDEQEITWPTAHFTEDHHHEPPPPELTVEEHFPHDHSAAAPKEVLESIDLTADEMEAHSASEEEIEEQPCQAHFTEDHHFEPPPPELQQDSEPKIGEEILPETEPLAGIDMTTDEMEEHSADEAETGPVHEIGYVNTHIFEPAPLPSEQYIEEEEEVGEESPAPLHAPETVESFSSEVPAEAPLATDEGSLQIKNDPTADNESVESAEPSSASVATPAVTEAQNLPVVSPTKETGTPTRAFNAIKPGLWDPSTPIRFGGRSLEAAVREAYYDPDRSANLKQSLEIEDDTPEPAPLEAEVTPNDVSQQKESLLPDELKRDEEEDLVPLPAEADSQEGIQQDDGMAEDTPALISSPGIRQADGSLTEAVQEGDYIGDTVSDALAEDSELPPLEPEVLLSLEGEDSDETPAQASASTSQSSKSPAEAEEEIGTDASAIAAFQNSGTIPTLYIESSSEDSDDEHHVATSLLSSRAQHPHLSTEAPANARRGRSRSRSTKTPGRKGKERASSVPDEDVLTVDSDSEAEPAQEDMEAEEAADEVERATTPEKDSNGRNVITTHIVPGSPISAHSPMEELEVSAMLAPRPSKPRFHRHGTSGSIHMFSPPSSRRGRLSPSSRSRTSAEPVSGSSAAPVHPDAEHHPHAHAAGATSGSPIQTRSQCTYRKLMIPNPYLGSINTPGRRISTRLARAAGASEESSQQHEFPSSFVFLVPGCVTADRKEQMLEGGIVDLGVASVEEEGSAMAIQSSEENESGLHVDGLPDSVVQSLVRVVGLEMFREGDCEILAPLIPQGPGSPARNGNNGAERKRRRESDMMSPPGNNKRLR